MAELHIFGAGAATAIIVVAAGALVWLWLDGRRQRHEERIREIAREVYDLMPRHKDKED